MATQEEIEVDAALESAMESDFSKTPEPIPYEGRAGRSPSVDVIWDVNETQRYKTYKILVACRSLLEYNLPVSTIGLEGRPGLWCLVRAVRSTTRYFYQLVLSRRGGESKDNRLVDFFYHKTEALHSWGVSKKV
jgi:hypothetical protein